MQPTEVIAAVDYGWYISLWKVIPLLAAVLLWARLLTWVDKDTEAAHLPRQALNTAFVFGMITAFVLFLAVPGFWLASAVFLVFAAAEVAVYLIVRQQSVGLGDLGKQFSEWVHGLGAKEKPVTAVAGEVLLINHEGAPYAAPEEESPELTAYTAVQELLGEPLRRGAERVEMRAGDKAAAVKYWVDGVSLDAPPIAKDNAAAAVTFLKELAAMDLSDRRKPQVGYMKASVDNKKRELQVLTAGSTAGESLLIEVDRKKRYELRLHELGLTEDQLNVLEETIAEGTGVVLLAAPKGHGLTCLQYAVLRRHDAFLSHIQTIEREPQTDLEGITQNPLPPNAAPAEEAKLTEWVASQEPDVLMIDRVDDPHSAMSLLGYAARERRAYIGLRAGGMFDALQMWRNLIGDDKQAMKHLKLIVAGRVMRRLCPACKVDYTPDPETLRRLNLPPERVGKLYTARSTPLRDSRGRELVCEFCLDLRFKGRTGVYELLVIDDEIRQAVQSGGSVNQLKMLFKKQRRRYLHELALMKAIAGETSLQEVARVLRAGESSPSPSGRRTG